MKKRTKITIITALLLILAAMIYWLAIGKQPLKSTDGTIRKLRRIEYGLDGTGGTRFKDPDNPTLFTLHKIGPLEPMVYVSERNRRLPVDGTPRIFPRMIQVIRIPNVELVELTAIRASA